MGSDWVFACGFSYMFLNVNILVNVYLCGYMGLKMTILPLSFALLVKVYLCGYMDLKMKISYMCFDRTFL